MVLRDLGRDKAAIDALSLAHEHDGRLIDAERQARVLRLRLAQERRSKAESIGRIGIKGIFGKK